jgi:hypothetical protein
MLYYTLLIDRINQAGRPDRADQFFKMECLLGWQLYCHPRKTPAIQGWQYNCHPNVVKN